MVDRGGSGRGEAEERRQRACRRHGRACRVPWPLHRPEARPHAAARRHRAGCPRLRLRQHDDQGRRALGGRRAAVLVLCPVARQPDRGREGGVPADPRRRRNPDRRARCHRLWQGPAQGHRRRGCAGRRDRRPRHRRAALLPGRRCDLRWRRLRRENHAAEPAGRNRLPAELAVLLGQRRIPPGRGRALRDAPRGLCRARLRSHRDALADDGLRRVPAIRHRQPAAQGLGSRGNHGSVAPREPSGLGGTRSGEPSTCSCAIHWDKAVPSSDDLIRQALLLRPRSGTIAWPEWQKRSFRRFNSTFWRDVRTPYKAKSVTQPS